MTSKLISNVMMDIFIVKKTSHQVHFEETVDFVKRLVYSIDLLRADQDRKKKTL